MIKKKTKAVCYFEAYGKEFENENDAEKYVNELNELLKCEHVVVSVNPHFKETPSDNKDELPLDKQKREVVYDTIVYSVNGEHAINKVLFMLQIETKSPLVDINYLLHKQFFCNDIITNELNMKDVYPRYEILETKQFDTIEDMLKFFNEDVELIKVQYNTRLDGVIMLKDSIINSEIEINGRKGINLLQ